MVKENELRNFKKREYGGYVYVCITSDNTVKIGITTEPLKRFQGLETSSGKEIIDWNICEACSNYKDIEKQLHEEYKDYRLKGEWFNCNYNDAVNSLAKMPKEHIWADFNKELINKITTNQEKYNENKIYYSKIPIILLSNNQEYNIFKIINNHKLPLVLDYLYNSTTRRDNIKFNLEDMIMECGYKIDKKPRGNNQQFKNILIKLAETGFVVDPNINLNKLKQKELVICKTVNIIDKYIKLYDIEKEGVLTYNQEKINNEKLLMYYCYFKYAIKNNNLDNVSKDLNIADTSIKKYNNILLNIL